jgi:hypothetical protein
MVSEQGIRDLASKALGDPDFRKKLLDDPEAAVAEAGLDLTPEQVVALKSMDRAMMEEGLANLDERLTMGCWGRGSLDPISPSCWWD